MQHAVDRAELTLDVAEHGRHRPAVRKYRLGAMSGASQALGKALTRAAAIRQHQPGVGMSRPIERCARDEHRLPGDRVLVLADVLRLIEAGHGEGTVPGVDVEDRARRPQRPIVERPPAVGDAEDEVQPARPARDLLQHQQAARRQQGTQVRQARGDVTRCVDDIGGEDDVVAAWLEALRARVALDVECRVVHRGGAAEARLRGADEERRDVGERETEVATCLQTRQHAGGRAAGAGPRFENAQLAPGGERLERRADSLGHQAR